MDKLSWRVKLVGLFALILGASLLFQALYVVPTVQDREVEMTQGQQEEIARNIARELDMELKRFKTRLTMTAEQPALRNMDIADQHQIMVANVETTPLISSLFVMDAEGWFVSGSVSEDNFSTYTTKSYADRPFFTVPFEQGQVYFGPPRFYPQLGLVGASVSVPIESDTGGRVGVLIGGMRLGDMMGRVANYPLKEGTVAYLVDSAGTVVAHSEIDTFALEEGPLSLDYSGNPQVRAFIDGGMGGSQVHDHDGTPYFGSCAILETNGWGAVVEAPMHVILAESNVLARRLLAINVGLFIIALAITLVFTRQITAQRKRAEEAVRKARDDYRATTNLTEDIIVQIDTEGRWTFLNDRACEFWDRPREELMGSAFADYLHPDDQEKTAAAVEDIMGGKTVRDLVNRQKTLKGWRTVLWNAAPIFEDEEYIGFQATGRDITERKRAEQTLQESEERLDLALEGTRAALWDWNVQTGETVFNERWAEIVGYELEELEPVSIETWEELVHPEDLERSEELLEKHFAGETDFYEFEGIMKHKNGDWVWIEDRGTVMEWDDEGSPVRMVGTHIDITERVRAEKELKESEEEYRKLSEEFELILDHIPGIVFYKDPENNFIRVNKRLAEAHDMTKEELEGKSLFELYPEEEAQEYWEDDKEVIESGEPKLNIVEPWSPDEKRWVSTSKIPYTVNGEVRGLIGISIDITERKEAEEELVESEEKFRGIYEESPIGIELYDSDGELVDVNQACLDIFGVVDSEELEGFKLFEDPNLAEEHKKKLREGEIVRHEMSFDFDLVKEHGLYETTKSGVIVIDTTITPLTTGESQLGYLVLVRDITDRKQAEERLKESEEKYRKLTENTSFGIGVSKGTELIFANAKLLDIFMVDSVDRFNEKPPLYYLTPESKEKTKERMKKLSQGVKVPGRFVVDIVRTDGQQRTLELGFSDITIDGEPCRLSTYNDITEPKRAAEAIRQKTEQQEVLLSSIPAFVYFKDTESKLITANKTFAEMVNTPIDQLPGKEAYDLFPKEQAEKFHVDDRKVMESGRPMMNIEEEFTDAEGKTRWASTSKVPYFDETGEVAGMVGTTFDITERKRAEREIEERRMYLEGVLGAAPDAIVTMDATGRIVEWNPGAERLFGYLQEEVVG